MQEIKVNVVDWWSDDFENNYFINFLSKKYKIVRSENPDYLFCSCFGFDHFKYRDCIKIFFTGENLTPDFNLYDYALGFDYIDFGSRYLRYPLFLLYGDITKQAEQKHIFNNPQEMFNRGFCSFVVSNGKNANPIRENFFDVMSQIDFVASGGGFRNNIGKRVENKIDFLKQYKFNIAFENSQYNGYCTEKLIEAFAAQTVPIYWGDPSLLNSDFINPKSYINLSSFSNTQEAIEYIREVNHNQDLYLSILSEPVFFKSNIQEYYENKLEKFFTNVFSNPPQVVLSNTRKAYQDKQKRLFYIKNLAHPIKYLKSYLARK